MGGGVGCRCCVCSTTAGSATLARAWLATVLLVGVVVASGGCHSRHDWALSRSGLPGLDCWNVLSGLPPLPVGVCRADRGLYGLDCVVWVPLALESVEVKKRLSTVAWVGLRLSPLLGLPDYGLVGLARKGLAGHRVAGGYGGGVLRPSLVATGLWVSLALPGLPGVSVVVSEAEAGQPVAAAGGSLPCRQGGCAASTAWCGCRWLWSRLR